MFFIINACVVLVLILGISYILLKNPKTSGTFKKNASLFGKLCIVMAIILMFKNIVAKKNLDDEVSKDDYASNEETMEDNEYNQKVSDSLNEEKEKTSIKKTAEIAYYIKEMEFGEGKEITLMNIDQYGKYTFGYYGGGGTIEWLELDANLFELEVTEGKGSQVIKINSDESLYNLDAESLNKLKIPLYKFYISEHSIRRNSK